MPRPREFRPADPLWINELHRRYEFGRDTGLAHIRAVMTEVRKEYAGLNREDFMAVLGYSDSQWDNWFTNSQSNSAARRNGPPFAVVQGIIHAFNVPPELLDPDFTGKAD